MRIFYSTLLSFYICRNYKYRERIKVSLVFSLAKEGGRARAKERKKNGDCAVRARGWAFWVADATSERAGLVRRTNVRRMEDVALAIGAACFIALLAVMYYCVTCAVVPKALDPEKKVRGTKSVPHTHTPACGACGGRGSKETAVGVV